jgi:tetratricopeptide (TPR) repeat protein
MSTANSSKKYSKRAKSSGICHDPLSKELGRASLLIGENDFESALALLNKLAGQYADKNAEVSKIIALVADSQLKLSRFDEAADIYEQALVYLSDPELAIRIWLRPSLGEVTALLKAVKPDVAYDKAIIIWKRAKRYQLKFEDQIKMSGSSLRNKGVVRIGKRPIRPSVVLYKLGNVFMNEGYVDVAKNFYQQAVIASPRGASRSREALARISLAEDSNDKAEQYSREALLMGKFQAKTVSVWGLLIAARVKQGKSALDKELFTSINLNAKGLVKARAIHAIVKNMRAYGDGLWKEIAEEWLQNEAAVDEVIEIELTKILLSEYKVMGSNPRIISRAAYRIFRSKKVSPMEMVASCKTIFQMELHNADKQPKISRLANAVERRFGASFKNEAIHAMALGAMHAKRHDTARKILSNQIIKIGIGTNQWGKDVWALARMENMLGNYSAAAENYLNFADQLNINERFRIQALLRWFEAVGKTSNEVETSIIISKLENVLKGITDYRVLLDTARDLVMAGSYLSNIANVVIDEAVSKASKAFHASDTPSQALRILIHLTRRQNYEFKAHSEIVSIWENLPVERRTWLWSREGIYWEYLALVFMAYTRIGDEKNAVKIAEEVIDSKDAPPEGYVFMGAAYANWLRRNGNLVGALETYDWVAQEVPTHPWASWAHYWLGLDHLASGRKIEAKQSFISVRKCYAGKPSYLWQYRLDAKSYWALKDEFAFDTNISMEGEFLLKQRDAFKRELELSSKQS